MPEESAPKPGHFLPGGAGDTPAETGGKTVPVDSDDDLVANPRSAPSLHTPTPPGYQSTPDEPTATPTPDLVVQQKNKLYSTGKLAPSKCEEPAYRPTSKENVKAYYQAMLVCLIELWMQRGFTGIDPASCNTFAATADKVS